MEKKKAVPPKKAAAPAKGKAAGTDKQAAARDKFKEMIAKKKKRLPKRKSDTVILEQYRSGTNSRKSLHVTNVELERARKEAMIPV